MLFPLPGCVSFCAYLENSYASFKSHFSRSTLSQSYQQNSLLFTRALAAEEVDSCPLPGLKDHSPLFIKQSHYTFLNSYSTSTWVYMLISREEHYDAVSNPSMLCAFGSVSQPLWALVPCPWAHWVDDKDSMRVNICNLSSSINE